MKGGWLSRLKYPTLRQGSRGTTVRTLQSLLVKRGMCSMSEVDGIFGPRTKIFVRKFQRTRGLIPDGIVGPQTWKELRKEPPVIKKALAKSGPTPTRGIKNNNPGNLEYTGTEWRGLADPPSDGRFCRFISPEFGMRALMLNLRYYFKVLGIDTLDGITDTWAPASDGNDPTKYAKFISKRTGIKRRRPIPLDRKHLALIAESIAVMENGHGFTDYSLDNFNKAAKRWL